MVFLKMENPLAPGWLGTIALIGPVAGSVCAEFGGWIFFSHSELDESQNSCLLHRNAFTLVTENEKMLWESGMLEIQAGHFCREADFLSVQITR